MFSDRLFPETNKIFLLLIKNFVNRLSIFLQGRILCKKSFSNKPNKITCLKLLI